MGYQRTVLLISSDDVGWREVRAILEGMPHVRIVGDTAKPSMARHLAMLHRPDVIVAAATLCGESILPLLADLHQDTRPVSKVTLLAVGYEPEQARALEELGIVGYLLWNDLSCAALRHVLALLIADDLLLGSRAVVTAFLAGLRGEDPMRLVAAGISARERAVLRQLAAGQTREEIATKECLSLRTVQRTIAELERKLGAPTLFLLGMKAMQRGLIR